MNRLEVPLRRRLLGFRVLASCALSLSLMWFVATLLDGVEGAPEWVEFVLAACFVIAIFAMFQGVVRGLVDVAIHWLPAGRMRNLLVDDKKNGQAIQTAADDFEAAGHIWALAPLYAAGLLLVLALAAILFLVAASSAASVFEAVSSWPSWAVVISVLLVLILMKK